MVKERNFFEVEADNETLRKLVAEMDSKLLPPRTPSYVIIDYSKTYPGWFSMVKAYTEERIPLRVVGNQVWPGDDYCSREVETLLNNENLNYRKVSLGIEAKILNDPDAQPIVFR